MENYLIDFDIAKREKEIQKGLDIFSKHIYAKLNINIKYIDNAALKIAAIYAEILTKKIKKLIPKKVSKFKMGAATALTVVKLQPIEVGTSEPDKILERSLNGELAFFLAMNLILDMLKPEGFELNSGIVQMDDAINSIKHQHITYLKLKELNDFPVFPIGSFYYCFFLIHTHKFMLLP